MNSFRLAFSCFSPGIKQRRWRLRRRWRREPRQWHERLLLKLTMRHVVRQITEESIRSSSLWFNDVLGTEDQLEGNAFCKMRSDEQPFNGGFKWIFRDELDRKGFSFELDAVSCPSRETLMCSFICYYKAKTGNGKWSLHSTPFEMRSETVKTNEWNEHELIFKTIHFILCQRETKG